MKRRGEAISCFEARFRREDSPPDGLTHNRYDRRPVETPP